MKIRRTHDSFSPMLDSRNRPLHGQRKKKTKTQEFRNVLQTLLDDQVDEGEEFRVLLPKHGHFWDNGYEDLE
jgi:hypothetical protein